MCFSRETLTRVPWNAFSQGEDLEYGLNLLLSGIVIEFAPEAVVLAAMPSNPKRCREPAVEVGNGAISSLAQIFDPTSSCGSSPKVPQNARCVDRPVDPGIR